jgi:hypothetical protein
MTEYLVRKGDGPWEIAHPAAVEDHEQECQTCKGSGRPRFVESDDPNETRLTFMCKDCDGKGHTGLGRIRLGWFNREGGLIGFDDWIDDVARLPE